MNTLDFLDAKSLRDDIPEFRPGDTLNVHVKVIEGSKERVQVLKGVVIRRQGGGVRGGGAGRSWRSRQLASVRLRVSSGSS